MKKCITRISRYNSTFNRIALITGFFLYLFLINQQVVYATGSGFHAGNDETFQQASISGTVIDKDGNPMPGVNILEKGTPNGTVTDLNGRYTISVSSPGATLVFSFLGYLSEEVEVSGKTVIDITLVEDIMSLDEVVVTALGIKREEKALGYSVQNVSGDGLQTVKGVDISTSLTGKVAGLLIKNTTEFAQESEIQIRGENPLLVIDGVPYNNMTLRDIPSDDIEGISVLKGATASALYGYRGESGAIMVTTKRSSGKKGLTVSVNSSTMFNAGFLAIPEMQSKYGRTVSEEDGHLVADRDGRGSWGPPLEGQEVYQWDPVLKDYRAMPYTARGKNNFKNFLEPGFILNNNISVMQQGEFGSLRSSVTWVNNKGQYPNSKFTKMTYMVGGDIKINKFGLSSSISYNKQLSPNIGFSNYRGYDPMYTLLVWSSPDWDVRDYEDYWLVPNEVQNNSYSALNNNPYFDRYERVHSTNRDIFNGSLSLNYELSEGVKATLRTGFDTYSDQQEVRVSMGSLQGAGTAKVITGGTEIWGESLLGSYNKGIGSGYSINNDLLLTFDQSVGDVQFDGLVGGSMFFHKDEGLEARTRGGLSIPGFYSLLASSENVAVKSILERRMVNSLFGRLGFSWKSLFFLEGTARNDWSSTLPESTRSYLYPSVSSSFVISELLPDLEWMSLWKLRGSWTLSKKPADIFAINNVYSISSNAWGDLSSASYPTAIRGTDVRPESSATFEIGTALNVYNNRASIDVAYYQKHMFDYIEYAGISDASGFGSNLINIDEERTRKGIELTARATPVRNSRWKWDITFNWSRYASYYTKIDSLFSQDHPWVKAGKRADHFTLYDFQKDPDGNIIHNAGLPLFSPYSSLFGNSDPDWIWGLSTSLKFKNLTFNVSVDGRVGGVTRTMTEMYMWRTGNHPDSDTPERYLDATQDGTSNYLSNGVQVVSGEATYDTYGNIISDTRQYAPNDAYVTYESYMNRIHRNSAWWVSPSPLDVYSTTFIKLREVSVTYDIPQGIYARVRSKGASVSVVGQNLFLWAKDFKYSDPDGGTENLSDPSIRYVGFNLKVVF